MNILCSRDSEEIRHDGGQGNGDEPPASKRASFLNCGQHLPSGNTSLGATVLGFYVNHFWYKMLISEQSKGSVSVPVAIH